MPSGTTHARATIAVAVTGSLVANYYGHPELHSLALAGGALTGLVLTPDLDVDAGCISHNVVRRTTGKGIGRLWRLFWLLYGKLMPHRSRLSHFPLLGTALRLLYLAIPVLLVRWAITGSTSLPHLPEWALWAVGGLALADTLHYLMDHLL